MLLGQCLDDRSSERSFFLRSLLRDVFGAGAAIGLRTEFQPLIVISAESYRLGKLVSAILTHGMRVGNGGQIPQVAPLLSE
jgi:hypothetical protein